MNGELISRDNVLKRLSVFKLQDGLRRKKDRLANEHFMNGVRSAIEVIVSEPAVSGGRGGLVVRVKKGAKKHKSEADDLARLFDLIYKAYNIAYKMAEGKDRSRQITSVRDLLWLASDVCYTVAAEDKSD